MPLELLMDLLFPPKCAFCGALMERSGEGICPRCADTLPWVPEDEVLRDVFGFPCAVALYYDGCVEEGIHALKFGGKPWRAQVFGALLARTVQAHLAGEFDAVAYAPVSLRRDLERGYDQGRLLARSAARALGAPVVAALRKVRHTRAQSTLDTAQARRENAQGAYAVPRPRLVEGRRLLLIDDVCTTGSTMAACADTLMAAGAAQVVCAALAGGHGAEAGEGPPRRIGEEEEKKG